MEHFDLLNVQGEVIGRASRDDCHSGLFLLHGVVHGLVCTSSGRIILQKRSANKHIEPGKWDTSIGGHISSGESLEDALKREAEEELGITGVAFERLYSFLMLSDIEREFVTTFRCIWDNPVTFPADEIADVRLFTSDEVESLIRDGVCTPTFEEDWKHYNTWLESTVI